MPPRIGDVVEGLQAGEERVCVSDGTSALGSPFGRLLGTKTEWPHPQKRQYRQDEGI
jgi:hypothetical protein